MTPRPGATATRLPDGDVLIVGGEDAAGNAIVNVTMYDPAEGVWMAAPGLAAPRMFHTATVLGDGRILIAGGTGSGGQSGTPLTTTEIFDPTSNTWTAGPAMGTAQAQVASSTSNTSGASSTSTAAASGAAASAVAASAPGAASTAASSTSTSSQPATTPLGVCQAATAGALAQVDAKFALTRTLISPLGDVVVPVLAQLADVRAMLGTQMADACAPLQGLSIPVPPSG